MTDALWYNKQRANLGVKVLFILNVLQIIQDSIEDIFKKYLPMMRSLALSILKDHHLSEDAVQEALVKLHRYSNKTGNINANDTKNFIYIVTRNEAINIKRQEERRDLFETDVPFSEDFVTSTVGGQLNVEQFSEENGFGPEISDFLNKLSLVDKDILTYKYSYGYSFKEIADTLGMKRDAVYKRHRRALDKLKVIIEEANEK